MTFLFELDSMRDADDQILSPRSNRLLAGAVEHPTFERDFAGMKLLQLVAFYTINMPES